MPREMYVFIYDIYRLLILVYKPKWVVQGNKIYLNSGIINILRSTFFSSPSAIGFRHKDLYRSSHPDRPEHELTIPLVALAATGVSYV
jgi:hypothetical protein